MYIYKPRKYYIQWEIFTKQKGKLNVWVQHKEMGEGAYLLGFVQNMANILKAAILDQVINSCEHRKLQQLETVPVMHSCVMFHLLSICDKQQKFWTLFG